jgi:hypothetical protein
MRRLGMIGLAPQAYATFSQPRERPLAALARWVAAGSSSSSPSPPGRACEALHGGVVENRSPTVIPCPGWGGAERLLRHRYSSIIPPAAPAGEPVISVRPDERARVCRRAESPSPRPASRPPVAAWVPSVADCHLGPQLRPPQDRAAGGLVMILTYEAAPSGALAPAANRREYGHEVESLRATGRPAGFPQRE